MMPYMTVYHGNPHSRTHMYGWESEAAVEHARKVSTLLPNLSPVIFCTLRKIKTVQLIILII